MKHIPPDLLDLYGKRYRVAYEESYYAQYGPDARTRDPWYMQILCKYGTIYPHGTNTLAASVEQHPGIAQRLKALPCTTISQEGDRAELTVTFPLANLPEVAKILQPRRRKQITEKERQRLRDIGRHYLFARRTGRQKRSAKGRKSKIGVRGQGGH